MNGIDAWLDSKFKNSDCLIDPGLCSEGFSISLKLSFFKVNSFVSPSETTSEIREVISYKAVHCNRLSGPVLDE